MPPWACLSIGYAQFRSHPRRGPIYRSSAICTETCSTRIRRSTIGTLANPPVGYRFIGFSISRWRYFYVLLGSLWIDKVDQDAADRDAVAIGKTIGIVNFRGVDDHAITATQVMNIETIGARVDFSVLPRGSHLWKD